MSNISVYYQTQNVYFFDNVNFKNENVMRNKHISNKGVQFYVANRKSPLFEIKIIRNGDKYTFFVHFFHIFRAPFLLQLVRLVEDLSR